MLLSLTKTADNAYIADIFSFILTNKKKIFVKKGAQPYAAITLEVN